MSNQNRGGAAGTGTRIELAAVSFLALFIELGLIRWIPSCVKSVSYFTNTVLLACFLGLGLGCALGDRGRRVVPWACAAVAALILAIGGLRWPILHWDWPQKALLRRSILVALPLLLTVVYFLVRRGAPGRSRAGLVARGAVVFAVAAVLLAALSVNAVAQMAYRDVEIRAYRGGGEFLVFLVPIVYALVVGSVVPLGAAMGRCFDALPPIPAYLWNIGGSLAGTLAFPLFTALELPPVAWFGFCLAALVPFALRSRIALVAGALLGAAALWLLQRPGEHEEYWSPYYHIEVLPAGGQGGSSRLVLRVNNDFFQEMGAVSGARGADPALRPLDRLVYDLPMMVAPRKRSVLVLGAGTGNDVSAALRGGAERVVAVEIDPLVQRLGKTRHPDAPYDDPRVEVVIDDARAFLNQTRESFDLIVYGVLDAHTVFSSFGNVRLESFVYTVEGLRRAWDRLAPGGTISLSFSSGRDWLSERLVRNLEQATGRRPLCLGVNAPSLGAVSDVFLVGRGFDVVLPASLPPQVGRKEMKGEVEASTDDWPHLYLKSRTLRGPYLVFLVVLGALTALFLRTVLPGAIPVDGVFLPLGAAFMLLETRSLTVLGLLFGTTWYINVVAIAAVLAVIGVANLLIHSGWKASWRLGAAGLLLSLLANALVPLEPLLGLSPVARAFSAGAIVGAPIFFAALVFADVFSRSADPARAIACNLLGAVFGGLLEYLSVLTGTRWLLAIALALYAIAMVRIRRHP